ncbi:MAG: YceI family protein [Rubrivivax sp.]|jgi:polyisoprenoid-binding protein YceI|nr:YceI family protein [Rubrivivax sp.]
MTIFRFTGLALVCGAMGLWAGVCLAQAKPAASPPAALPVAQLVSAGSEIVFTTRQLGVPVEGKFQRFTAQIALDPKKPETGSVAFAIDTTSTRFGSAELDAEVPKAIWLDTKRFPQASFASKSVKGLGGGRFEVAGALTIKGNTRDLLVPVQLVQAGGSSTASGSFTIKRIDFKVGEGEWTDTSMLANDVVVRFKLQLTGVPAL